MQILLAALAVVLQDTPIAPAPGFAVVAPAEWQAAVQPLLDARRAELTVEFAALEDVLAKQSDADAPERLKRVLYQGWKERGLAYVLLVGDADTLPVRFMVLDRFTEPAANFAFYASDLYYADVARDDGSFDDWNSACDDFHARYFGEVRGETNKDTAINFDRVSYVPELAVGRWPVSDAASLAAVVAKTLAWKPAESPRALVVHAGGWVDAREQAGRIGDRLAARGFAVDRQLYGEDESVPSPATVLKSLATGVDLALHVGHGTDEGWHACLGPAEREALATARPAVYFSVGCSTGHFCAEAPYQAYLDDAGIAHRGTNHGEVFTAPPPPPAALQPGRFNSSGLGERLLRMPHGGAVAYIGCNTGAQPCALTLLEGFTLALRPAGAQRVGDAWKAALAHYWDAEHLATLAPDDSWYPPSIFFQGMKFMLLGDPTLALVSR